MFKMLITMIMVILITVVDTSSSVAKKKKHVVHASGGRGTFVFNPNSHTWTAYNASGKAIRSGVASGGKSYCPDIKRGCRTPVGRFAVYSKGSAGCKSSKFPIEKPGAPMPWCMFFRGGYAIHGSYEVPRANVSHGCIRVHPSAAAWLSHNFMRIGTVVIVKPY